MLRVIRLTAIGTSEARAAGPLEYFLTHKPMRGRLFPQHRCLPNPEEQPHDKAMPFGKRILRILTTTCL